MSLRQLVQPLRAPVGRQLSRLLAAFDAPPSGLRAGWTAGRSRNGPIALVLLFGADEEAIAATATTLAEVAALGHVRPLLVLDRPAFAVVRRAGLPVEYVVDEQTWRSRGEPQPWSEHLQVRLSQLRRDYVADLCLMLPPGGIPALPEQVLAAGLSIPARPAATAVRRYLGGALERLLDPTARG